MAFCTQYLVRKIMQAAAIHENSYVKGKYQDGHDYPTGGYYAITQDQACHQVAGDIHEAIFLNLASHWANDIEELGKDLGMVYEFQLDGKVINIVDFRSNPIDKIRSEPQPQMIVRDMTKDEIAARKAQREKWVAEEQIPEVVDVRD
jgi:hypothetical protein